MRPEFIQVSVALNRLVTSACYHLDRTLVCPTKYTFCPVLIDSATQSILGRHRGKVV